MRDDTDMDRRGAVRTMLGVGALPLVGACARAMGPRSALTRRQLAGQRVIFSYPGLTVPPALLKQISAGQAAGVIFFGENVSSEAQIASVIRQLRQAQRRSPVASPLLFMTDQEGGLVRRLPGAPALSEKQAGAAADPVAAARTAGAGAGRNLAGAGLNVNLAPVLDVYHAPGDFTDQYQRSQAPGRAVVRGDPGRAARPPRLPGSDHHRRHRGVRAGVVRRLRPARRARRPGRGSAWPSPPPRRAAGR